MGTAPKEFVVYLVIASGCRVFGCFANRDTAVKFIGNSPYAYIMAVTVNVE